MHERVEEWKDTFKPLTDRKMGEGLGRDSKE